MRTANVELLQLVATGNVPNIHRFIRRQMKRGHSIQKLLHDVGNAMGKCRQCKVHGYTDEDISKGLLLWKLGGRACVRVGQELGLPSITRMYKHDLMKAPGFIMSPGDYCHWPWILELNMGRQFFRKPSTLPKALYNIQADNTATTKDCRMHPKYGWILGMCNMHA